MMKTEPITQKPNLPPAPAWESFPTALAAKVKAVNTANTYAKELHRVLSAVFAPFVGHQVVKVDGSLLAKVKAAMPELPYRPALSVYHSGSNYSLAWMVKAASEYEKGSGYQSSIYHEVAVYVGELWNGPAGGFAAPNTFLKCLVPSNRSVDGLRTDWTAAEVEEKRKMLAKAKEALREAEGGLHPFGENDR